MKLRGFTLVELLITIAIIGILAAVVLPRLQNARDEGVDAKVRAELNALSRRAAVEESQVRHYDFVCGTNGETQSTAVADIITSINSLAPAPIVCNSSAGEFAVSAPLRDSGEYACVDRSGEVTDSTTALTAGVFVCP